MIGEGTYYKGWNSSFIGSDMCECVLGCEGSVCQSVGHLVRVSTCSSRCFDTEASLLQWSLVTDSVRDSGKHGKG